VLWAVLLTDPEVLAVLQSQLSFLPVVGALDFLSPRLTVPVGVAWALLPFNAVAFWLLIAACKDHYLAASRREPLAVIAIAVLLFGLAPPLLFILPAAEPGCSYRCIREGDFLLLVWCLGISHVFAWMFGYLLFCVANMRSAAK